MPGLISEITMSSMLIAMNEGHNVRIYEGERFKQAWYNNRLNDTPAQVADKIGLAIKHYPGQDLWIGLYEGDLRPFSYAVVFPA